MVTFEPSSIEKELFSIKGLPRAYSKPTSLKERTLAYRKVTFVEIFELQTLLIEESIAIAFALGYNLDCSGDVELISAMRTTTTLSLFMSQQLLVSHTPLQQLHVESST
jgi:hypothetical protein